MTSQHPVFERDAIFFHGVYIEYRSALKQSPYLCTTISLQRLVVVLFLLPITRILIYRKVRWGERREEIALENVENKKSLKL